MACSSRMLFCLLVAAAGLAPPAAISPPARPATLPSSAATSTPYIGAAEAPKAAARLRRGGPLAAQMRTVDFRFAKIQGSASEAADQTGMLPFPAVPSGEPCVAGYRGDRAHQLHCVTAASSVTNLEIKIVRSSLGALLLAAFAALLVASRSKVREGRARKSEAHCELQMTALVEPPAALGMLTTHDRQKLAAAVFTSEAVDLSVNVTSMMLADDAPALTAVAQAAGEAATNSSPQAAVSAVVETAAQVSRQVSEGIEAVGEAASDASPNAAVTAVMETAADVAQAVGEAAADASPKAAVSAVMETAAQVSRQVSERIEAVGEAASDASPQAAVSAVMGTAAEVGAALQKSAAPVEKVAQAVKEAAADASPNAAVSAAAEVGGAVQKSAAPVEKVAQVVGGAAADASPKAAVGTVMETAAEVSRKVSGVLPQEGGALQKSAVPVEKVAQAVGGAAVDASPQAPPHAITEAAANANRQVSEGLPKGAQKVVKENYAEKWKTLRMQAVPKLQESVSNIVPSLQKAVDDGVKTAAPVVEKAVKTAAPVVEKAASDLAPVVKQGTESASLAAQRTATDLAPLVKQGTDSVSAAASDGMTQAANNIRDAASNAAKTVSDVVLGKIQSSYDGLPPKGKANIESIKRVGDTVTNVAGPIVDGGAKIATPYVEAAKDTVSQAAGRTLKSQAKDMLGWLNSWVRD